MRKKYVAMGIASLLLLTSIPGTVYATEPMVIAEEQSEEESPEATGEETAGEELKESENKELQEGIGTGDGEASEEILDNPENPASGEMVDGEETGGQENQAQEDEGIHYEEEETNPTNNVGQDSEETDIAQSEASLEEVPEEQDNTLDAQSTEGEYLPYEGAKYKLRYGVEEEGIIIN